MKQLTLTKRDVNISEKVVTLAEDRVQDGAGDRELRVFRDFSAIKISTNRLQAGYRKVCVPSQARFHQRLYDCYTRV